MKMKTLFLSVLTMATLAVAPIALAQTNQPALPPSFLQTVQGYFTRFNADLTNTFSAGKRLDLWTAGEQNLGNNTSADLGIEYTLWRPASNSIALSGECVLKAAGVAGTIVGTQAGAGISYVYKDTKLTFYVDGGYDFLNKAIYCEPGLRVKKALTDNTYVGVGIGIPIERRMTGRQNLYLFAGFTF